MTPDDYLQHLRTETEALKQQALYKQERVLTTPQGAIVCVAGPPPRQVVNLCATN